MGGGRGDEGKRGSTTTTHTRQQQPSPQLPLVKVEAEAPLRGSPPSILTHILTQTRTQRRRQLMFVANHYLLLHFSLSCFGKFLRQRTTPSLFQGGNGKKSWKQKRTKRRRKLSISSHSFFLTFSLSNSCFSALQQNSFLFSLLLVVLAALLLIWSNSFHGMGKNVFAAPADAEMPLHGPCSRQTDRPK